eukprot:70552-Rhodomonas_salina.5
MSGTNAGYSATRRAECVCAVPAWGGHAGSRVCIQMAEIKWKKPPFQCSATSTEFCQSFCKPG